MVVPRGDALRVAQRLPLAIIFRAFGAPHTELRLFVQSQRQAGRRRHYLARFEAHILPSRLDA
jgi:hypothetical protein